MLKLILVVLFVMTAASHEQIQSSLKCDSLKNDVNQSLPKIPERTVLNN